MTVLMRQPLPAERPQSRSKVTFNTDSCCNTKKEIEVSRRLSNDHCIQLERGNDLAFAVIFLKKSQIKKN